MLLNMSKQHVVTTCYALHKASKASRCLPLDQCITRGDQTDVRACILCSRLTDRALSKIAMLYRHPRTPRSKSFHIRPANSAILSSHIPCTETRESIRAMSPAVRKALKINALFADVPETLRLLAWHLTERVHASSDGHRCAPLRYFRRLLLDHRTVFW